MKQFLFSALLIGGIGTASAQSDINISGHLDNASGSPVSVDISVDDLGNPINNTVMTDAAGDFSLLVTVSAGASQGVVDMSFTDCNGVSQSTTGSWFPGSLAVDLGAIDYCPATPPACDASFTITQEYVGNSPVPNSLLVANTSTGSNLTHTWDFGDGNTATGATPSHTYAAPGPFNLCLTIDDGNGCTQMFCDSIGVNAAGLTLGKQAGFTINITGGATAGIEDVEENYTFNVFPNPAMEHANLELGSLSETADLRLFNLSGKVVYTQLIEPSTTTQLVSIDLSSIPEGVYTINVLTSRGAHNQRLIVK